MKFIFVILVLFYHTFAESAEDADWYVADQDDCKTKVNPACDTDPRCKWFPDAAPATTGKCKYDACRTFDSNAAKCEGVGWCVYITGTGTCIHDTCLTSIPTTPTPNAGSACSSQTLSTTLSALGTCQLYYFSNKTDCTSGSTYFDDYFCQFTPSSSSAVTIPVFDYCFYKRLKNFGTDPTYCDSSLCESVKVQGSFENRYVCQSNGADDCSVYAEMPEEWCACVENEVKCNLSPYCWWNNSKCTYDNCTKQFDITNTCAYNCYKRNMNYANADGTVGLKPLCVDKGRTSEKALPNECFFLLGSTDACSGDDESVCSGAMTTNLEGSSPDLHIGSNIEPFCKVVEIAEGIFPGAKYCADTREVPILPGSGSVLMHVPSLLAFLLIALLTVL